MMACHELFGFMPPELANEILEYSYSSDKQIYRAALTAIADARRVRPIYLERKPRTERHKDMLDMLSRPRMEAIAADLLRAWLIKAETPMLIDFLNTLEIPHKEGVVDDFPETIDDSKLDRSIDVLVSKYPPMKVAVYLHALCATNDGCWDNLQKRLQEDSRVQLG